MNPHWPPPLLELAVRYGLGGLLLWAAVSKLANPTAFLGSLYAYELPLPAPFLKAVAIVLPWTELLCGLLLLANTWPVTTLLTVAGLLAVFVLATAQAAARGLEISCGCFDLQVLGWNSAAEGTVRFLESPTFAFARNLALLGAAAWLLRLQRLPLARTNDHPDEPTPSFPPTTRPNPTPLKRRKSR